MIIALRVSPKLALEPEYLERLVANGIAFGVENFPSLKEEDLTVKINWEAFNFPMSRLVAAEYLKTPERREQMLCFNYFLNVAGEFEVIHLYETGHTTLDDQSVKIPTLWDYVATQLRSVVDFGIEANPVLRTLNPRLKDLVLETAKYFADHHVVPQHAGMFGGPEQVVFMTGYNDESLYASVLKNISEQYKNGK